MNFGNDNNNNNGNDRGGGGGGGSGGGGSGGGGLMAVNGKGKRDQKRKYMVLRTTGSPQPLAVAAEVEEIRRRVAAMPALASGSKWCEYSLRTDRHGGKLVYILRTAQELAGMAAYADYMARQSAAAAGGAAVAAAAPAAPALAAGAMAAAQEAVAAVAAVAAGAGAGNNDDDLRASQDSLGDLVLGLAAVGIPQQYGHVVGSQEELAAIVDAADRLQQGEVAAIEGWGGEAGGGGRARKARKAIKARKSKRGGARKSRKSKKASRKNRH